MSAFLFLAPNIDGWGETILGVRLAQDLAAAGHTSTFLAPAEGAPMFAGLPVAHEPFTRATQHRFARLVDDLVRRLAPAALVLCDVHCCARFFHERAGVDPAFLDAYQIPALAIDVYDQARVGDAVDSFLSSRWVVPPGVAERVRPLLPCPIVAPAARPGVYANLPAPVRLDPDARARQRARWGLDDDARVVLLCTAQWQQSGFREPEGNTHVTAIPRLIEQHVAALGPRVHLVHVGPARLPLLSLLGERYRFFPHQTPAEFSETLGSADLLLSLNVMATTNVRAIVSDLPVLLVRNSHRLTRKAPLPPGVEPTAALVRWLKGALPLYPFHVWPIGMWSYLSPTLADNAYVDAMQTVELLDEPGFHAAATSLLDDPAARARLVARQRAYVAQVRALPGAAEVVTRALG